MLLSGLATLFLFLAATVVPQGIAAHAVSRRVHKTRFMRNIPGADFRMFACLQFRRIVSLPF
jgi:hypothetical protein